MRNKRKIKQERKQKFFNKIVTKRDFIEYIHYLDGLELFDSANSISKREVYKFKLTGETNYFIQYKKNRKFFKESKLFPIYMFSRKAIKINIDLIVNINNCIFLEKTNI